MATTFSAVERFTVLPPPHLPKINLVVGAFLAAAAREVAALLMGSVAAFEELVSLPINSNYSPEEEEEVVGRGTGFTREMLAVFTDCGFGHAWANGKRAVVCISQTGSGIGGTYTSGVRVEGRVSSRTMSICRFGSSNE